MATGRSEAEAEAEEAEASAEEASRPSAPLIHGTLIRPLSGTSGTGTETTMLTEGA